MKLKVLFAFTLLSVAAINASLRACEDCDLEKTTFPLHGVVATVNDDRKTITVSHGETKGLLPVGVTQFLVDPQLLPLLKPSQEIIARIDKRNDQLWLVSINIVPPPPAGVRKG
ncbi:MAG TPA: copper-binding protein [Opitutaceae bacterium]|nr:copper-binding protein [Opitutaceae bacterium]